MLRQRESEKRKGLACLLIVIASLLDLSTGLAVDTGRAAERTNGIASHATLKYATTCRFNNIKV